MKKENTLGAITIDGNKVTEIADGSYMVQGSNLITFAEDGYYIAEANVYTGLAEDLTPEIVKEWMRQAWRGGYIAGAWTDGEGVMYLDLTKHLNELTDRDVVDAYNRGEKAIGAMSDGTFYEVKTVRAMARISAKTIAKIKKLKTSKEEDGIYYVIDGSKSSQRREVGPYYVPDSDMALLEHIEKFYTFDASKAAEYIVNGRDYDFIRKVLTVSIL
jgi:hypothetical protein